MDEGRSFGELLAGYLEACRARGEAPSGLPNKRQAVLRLFAFLHGRGLSDVREVRPEDVVSFVAFLRELRSARGRLLAHVTVTSSVGFVRGFFAFLLRRGLVLVNPAADIHLPWGERLPRGVPSEEEARRLVEAPSPETRVGLRDCALLELLYGSGLRLRECVRLDLTDVNLLGGTVFVRDGKGRRDRVTPLSARTILALETYLRRARGELAGRRPEPALFVSYRGSRLTPDGVQQVVAIHAKRLGLGTLHPHALRHACATHLLRGGADVRHVQKILGHKSIRSTMLYTRVDVSDLARVIERSHPRERRKARRR